QPTVAVPRVVDAGVHRTGRPVTTVAARPRRDGRGALVHPDRASRIVARSPADRVVSRVLPDVGLVERSSLTRRELRRMSGYAGVTLWNHRAMNLRSARSAAARRSARGAVRHPPVCSHLEFG